MLLRLMREMLKGIRSRISGQPSVAENVLTTSPHKSIICPSFAQPDEAVEWIRNEVLPALKECLDGGRYQEASRIENIVYSGAIKRFEFPEHYATCLSLLHPTLEELGRRSAHVHSLKIPESADWVPARIVFFVHNLSASLAHNDLLSNVLRAYLSCPGASPDSVSVVGMGKTVADSYRALIDEYGLVVHNYSASDLYSALQKLVSDLDRQPSVRLIVVAVPLGLSYLSGLLHPMRLGWLSMKFEIDAFSPDLPCFSFTSSRRQIKRVGNTLWRTAPPLLMHLGEALRADAAPLSFATDLASYDCVLYTINREEKIKQQPYLEAVARLLSANSQACFVWTGREQPIEIAQFFVDRGVNDRVYFAGWIDPDSLLRAGHLFLDTPTLSGMVAARAVALGLPVVTFSKSHSWVNFFADELDSAELELKAPELGRKWKVFQENGLRLECESIESYVELAQKLIDDKMLRAVYCDFLQEFGGYFFSNGQAYAAMHFENFYSPMSASAESF